MNSISVNDMLERLQDYIFGELASGVGIEHHVLTQNTVAVLAATIVVGLLIGFLGWKIVRVWAALAGFVLGFVLGVLISAFVGLSGTGVLAAGFITAVVLAVLAAVLYRVGVFLIVLLSVCSLAIQILDPQNGILLAVCLVIALVAAILSVRFVSVLTIFVTGIYGAVVAGTAVFELLPVSGELIRILICIILAAGGIAVQLLLESRKQKKASLKKAEQIREENSTANDVERARAMMDDFGKAPEDEEDED